MWNGEDLVLYHKDNITGHKSRINLAVLGEF